MSIFKEEYDPREEPERLFYATGVFLDAEDLQAEQNYHRGRMSRVLAHLHGSGTAVGLEVAHHFDVAGGLDRITVSGGFAIDGLGRIIEVPRPACLDLKRWFEHQQEMVRNPDEFTGEAKFVDAVKDGTELFADIYARFVVCPRGRTPAFATGPFDSIDATVPSRLRDSYELTLELRGPGLEDTLPTGWPDPADSASFSDWQSAMRDKLKSSWSQADTEFSPPGWTVGLTDPHSVFLARISIPVTVPAAGADDEGVPQRVPDVAATVDDSSRLIVWPTAALVRWLEALSTFPPS